MQPYSASQSLILARLPYIDGTGSTTRTDPTRFWSGRRRLSSRTESPVDGESGSAETLRQQTKAVLRKTNTARLFLSKYHPEPRLLQERDEYPVQSLFLRWERVAPLLHYGHGFEGEYEWLRQELYIFLEEKGFSPPSFAIFFPTQIFPLAA